MLAFEPKEPDIMQRLPRNPNTPILTGELIMRILLVGTLLLHRCLWSFSVGTGQQVPHLEKARTVAVNTFVIMELFYLFNCRSMNKSIFQLGVFTNMWVFGGVAVMLLYPDCLHLSPPYAPIVSERGHRH